MALSLDFPSGRLLQQQQQQQRRELQQQPIREDAVLIFLIALIVVLCLVLFVILLPLVRQNLQRRRRRARVPQRRIDRRYATIDSWLIRKTVRAHNNTCYRVQKYYGIHARFEDIDVLRGKKKKSDDEKTTTAMTTTTATLAPPCTNSSCPGGCGRGYVNNTGKKIRNDDDDNEEEYEAPSCSICMEPFKVGDQVSWSTDTKCGHVFHHSCIREWLLRHVGCPYCRCVFLPVDRPVPATEVEVENEDDEDEMDNAVVAGQHRQQSVAPSTYVGGAGAAVAPNDIESGNMDNGDMTQTRTNRTSIMATDHRRSRFAVVTDTVSLVWYGTREVQQQVQQHKRNLKKSAKYIDVLDKERSLRARTTYYCITDGLVVLRASAAAEAKAAEERKEQQSKRRKNRKVLREITRTEKKGDSPPPSPSSTAGMSAANGVVQSNAAAGAAAASSSSSPLSSSSSSPQHPSSPIRTLLGMAGNKGKNSSDHNHNHNHDSDLPLPLQLMEDGSVVDNDEEDIRDDDGTASVFSATHSISSAAPTLDSSGMVSVDGSTGRSTAKVQQQQQQQVQRPPSLLVCQGVSSPAAAASASAVASGREDEVESDTDNDELLEDAEAQLSYRSLTASSIASAPTLDSGMVSGSDTSNNDGDEDEADVCRKPPSLLLCPTGPERRAGGVHSGYNINGNDDDDESDTENDELFGDMELQLSQSSIVSGIGGGGGGGSMSEDDNDDASATDLPHWSSNRTIELVRSSFDDGADDGDLEGWDLTKPPSMLVLKRQRSED